jgi:hypothetical protein
MMVNSIRGGPLHYKYGTILYKTKQPLWSLQALKAVFRRTYFLFTALDTTCGSTPRI